MCHLSTRDCADRIGRAKMITSLLDKEIPVPPNASATEKSVLEKERTELAFAKGFHDMTPQELNALLFAS